MNAGTSKIFGIGLSKTGTTSLARALDILGYRTRDYLGVTHYRTGDLSSVDLDIIDSNDAFTDTPIPSFYRQLDKAYPGSKFILTVRDKEGWLKSCKKQFNQKLADKQNEATRQVFLDLYGTNVFDEEKFSAGYDRFVTGVKDYFRERPEDLLILDVAAGDGWEQLCPFLGKEIPDIPFPRANVTRIRWMDINQLVAAAQEAAGQIAYAVELSRQRKEEALGLLQRTGILLKGGEKACQQRALKRARKIILEKLEGLNADIPVVLAGDPLPPYDLRRNWNHFWLVDLIGTPEALAGDAGTPTFSIALIEDRKPIMGVISAPRLDAICYASAGKPAIRTTAYGKAEPLNLSTECHDHTDLPGCVVHGALPPEQARLKNTTEWNTAAAQVILESAGYELRTKGQDRPLAYNKEDPRNPPLIVSKR